MLEEFYSGERIYATPRFATIHPAFDFETYSEAGYLYNVELRKWQSLPGYSSQNRGLKAVGMRNYVCHPSFRLLSAAWNLKDQKGIRWWRPPEANHGMSIPWTDIGELLAYVESGGVLEAHNMEFEYTVWMYYCVPVLGWPPLAISQLRCSMAKARAVGYPGALEELGLVLKLAEKKDPEGKRLIRKLTVPRNPTKGNDALRWTPTTAPDDFANFYRYNIQDVRTESEASSRIPDLTPHELEVWRTHFAINMRGMHIDTQARDNCIAIVEQCVTRGHAELYQLTNAAVSSTSEVAKILEWCAKAHGVYLRSLSEDDLQEALLRTDYPLPVQRVLRLREALSFGSVKKLYALRGRVAADERLHNQYVYYGAHTGLWNGEGVQPANLYSGVFKKPEEAERALSIIGARSVELIEYEYPDHEPLEIVASCLRSLIIASPGCRLISADYSAIQAVVTSCLAGEQWRIDVFRTHGKIYEMMAAMLTGKTLQFYLDYKEQNRKHHLDRQNYGKIPVLSADFGAWVSGWKRFGADKLGDDATIKALILRTRQAIPWIVEFWGGQTRNKFNKGRDGSYAQECAQLYGLEGAAISAVLEPGKAFGYRDVAFQMLDDILFCQPPSGGLIAYHKPRLEPSRGQYASPWELDLSYEGWNSNATKGAIGWTRMPLYGGVLTQNVVSHVCREVQALTLIRLERHDYPVVMHTHDENVTDVPIDRGSKDEYQRLVAELPTWARFADGSPWPIKVPDAWEAQRYGKWED